MICFFLDRSVIQLCISEMKLKIDEENESDEMKEFKATYELLHKMELILSLIEILFIDAKPGKNLT